MEENKKTIPSEKSIESIDSNNDNVNSQSEPANTDSEMDSNVSEQEREDLSIAANSMPGDDENLRKAALDNKDKDGTPLNEGSFKNDISPDDLDVPGSDLDNADERIGEEDEENNEYSLGGDNHEDAERDDF